MSRTVVSVFIGKHVAEDGSGGTSCIDMIEPGMRFESAAEVGPDNTASVMGSGDMEVLATPSMVALMENAAMRAVERALPEGSTTVGTRIDVSHVRASAQGEPITATAEVTKADG